MTKDLRFTITLVDVKDGLRRAAVKTLLEDLTGAFSPGMCKQVRVSRFNPGNEVRKARVMQQMATDAISNAVSKNGNNRGGAKN